MDSVTVKMRVRKYPHFYSFKNVKSFTACRFGSSNILTDACWEELSVYAYGILEKVFQRRNIAFIEETESVFRESIRELDKEAEEDPDDPDTNNIILFSL